MEERMLEKTPDYFNVTDIQHGIVPHRHLYVRMQQVQHFVFQQHFAPIQVRH